MTDTETRTLTERIETKIRAALAPELLEVVNESSLHNVPPGSETHFKLVIVARAFEGQAMVLRHRLVYAALSEEMTPGKIHALAITSRTPSEWDASPEANTSPLCRGGSKA